MIFDAAITRLRNEGAYQSLTLDNPAGWLTGRMPNISPATAMKVSAVNGCVEVLSNSMSKLPIYVMDGNTRKHVTDHPILRLLSVRPNEAMTPTDYKKLLEANRLLWGNGYAWIYRDRGSGRPRELIPLPAPCVQPYIDPNGSLWYIFTNPRTGDVKKLYPSDVIHYKAFSEDGITGVSVLSRARETISIARSAIQYERMFYEQGGRPSGVLSTDSDLEEKSRDAIRGEWEKVHAGAGNAFRVAVLDLGLKYQPIGMSNADAQFVESKSVSVEDISRFFGVPLYKLNAGKQSYNANEQNAIEYVVGTLHPIVSRCEEEDTWKLLFDSDIARGLQIRRNMMAELRGDFQSRGTWYKNMREVGAYSSNDIRALEDEPSIDGGDIYYGNLNYVPLDQFRELSKKRNENGGTKV